jgi:hypothetical protein
MKASDKVNAPIFLHNEGESDYDALARTSAILMELVRVGEAREETPLFAAYLREQLLGGLAKCSEGQVHRFHQMYGGGNKENSIEVVVEKMPTKKLCWAFQQVQRTLEKD